MAATYGYGGEFSSDEDIDRMEQHSERLVQSKFDSYTGQSNKPSKQAIEEAIVAIKSMPLDQDITLTDELLAGLLDHYKTQRGPIVDSTRNLYKKIILRLIRGSGDKAMASSNGDSNGNSNNNNNDSKKPQQVVEAAASSDEDEPMPPASSQESATDKRKFDSRVVYNEDRLEPMEVDSETPAGVMRSNKNVDISSSSEVSSGSDDDEAVDESEDESDSDSEEADVTPVKEKKQSQQKAAPGQKSSDMVKKPSTTNVAANKEAATLAEAKKKPYTRSQRIAATRASPSSSSKKTDVSSSRVETSVSDTKSLAQRSQKLPLKFIISAVFIAMVAALLYHFRSDLTKSSERILSRAIKF